MPFAYSPKVATVADMATPKGTHFIVTANFLRSGAPAYMRPDSSWSSALQEAHPADEAERDAMLAGALAEEAVVCDAYAFPARLLGSVIDPLTAREEIRAKGPTVAWRRPDPDSGETRPALQR
jgi:hypothetical protein